MSFSNISAIIHNFDIEKKTLCADIIISDIVVAHYSTGKIDGVAELSFAKEQEHTFVAWSNKNKIASLMLKSGWKTLYPTIQKVPYYAQLVFVADHLIDEIFRKNQVDTLISSQGAKLISSNGQCVEVLEWENAVDFNDLLTQRQGLERVQRYYDKLVKRARSESMFILTPKEQLASLGVITCDEAHVSR